MRPFLRADEPQMLIENAIHWGQQWQERRQKKPGAQWKWLKHHGKSANHLLLPLLAGQSQWHCSYCDCNEIGSKEESIDHFRPKSNPAFYHLAYAWSNLYYVCWNCQKSKMEKWSDENPFLAPDEEGYSFDYYFIYNSRTGEIEPNPRRTAAEMARVEITIHAFGLKDFQKHCIGRRRTWNTFVKESSDPNFNLDDHPYRYLISLVT